MAPQSPKGSTLNALPYGVYIYIIYIYIYTHMDIIFVGNVGNINNNNNMMFGRLLANRSSG